MEDITARLIAMFVLEVDERVDLFERELLVLEHGVPEAERAELVDSLLRGAHSLKGAATAVGSTVVETACHGLEDLLSALREQRIVFDPRYFGLLFETADGLREAATRLRAGEQPSPELAELGPRLSQAATGTFFEGVPSLRTAEGPQLPVAGSSNGAASTTETVRVDSTKLDALLLESGELLVANYHARSRLEECDVLKESVRRQYGSTKASREIERSIDRLAASLTADQAVVERAARRVDGEIRRMRMMPFATVCDGLERIVRDAARSVEKEVVLRVHGGDIELDRSIVDGLRGPLVHLVRNAVDHGFESAAKRTESGKPAAGTVSITAELRGNGVQVTVEDDGAGVNFEALQRRVQQLGLTFDELDPTAALFLPGISTAANVTHLSGRGVGLDAVRVAVHAMRGAITVSTVPGRGTRVVLSLPLTLTSLRVVMFEIAGEPFAVDTAIVQRVLRARTETILSIQGRPVLSSGDDLIPLVPFRAVLDRPGENAPVEVVTAVIVNAADRQIALQVDRVTDEREIVVRSLGRRLAALPTTAGAAILADGSIALIVHTAFVLERALQLTRTLRHRAKEESTVRKKRILLVDDSLTTRTLERSILEAAEYDVLTAEDGGAAWNVLDSNEVDLVVSDVDMPKMDGFSLVEAIRASERFRGLPVVLVTAREKDEDKRRGLEVGADAYVLKSTFDQRSLLDTIRALF